MYGNGAGIGMEAYQATLQVQARLRALAAVCAVALGSASLICVRLTTGATITRTAGTSPMVSALFAPQNSVG